MTGATKRIGLSVAVGVLAAQGSSLERPLPLEQLMSTSLCVRSLILPLQVLDNSGAQDSLLDEELAAQAGWSLYCHCLLSPQVSYLSYHAMRGRQWRIHRGVPHCRDYPTVLLTLGFFVEKDKTLRPCIE